MSIKQIGMPMKVFWGILWNSAALLEEVTKSFKVFRKMSVSFTTKTDIEITALAEAPAITLQILTKVKFRGITLYLANILLRRTHLEFNFLCSNDRLTSA